MQWSEQQIHDTVAAIARGASFGHAARRSLLGRLFDYLTQWLYELFRAVEGSLNARVILGLAVAAIAAVVIGRVVMDRRMAEAAKRRSGVRARSGGRMDYWAAAAAAAADLRFSDACHALHAAVIDDLASAGAVRWHPSKTSGDYVREMRRRGVATHGTFRAFARDFERTVFGVQDPTREDYERLRREAELLLSRRAAA